MEYNPNEKGFFYGASPIIHEFAKRLRAKQTPTEKILWEYLNRNQLGTRFRRQHPILYFIADFYCHDAKLVVEVDGDIHKTPHQYEYDVNRDWELKDLGVHVLRFHNDEVLADIKDVIERIKTKACPNRTHP